MNLALKNAWVVVSKARTGGFVPAVKSGSRFYLVIVTRSPSRRRRHPPASIETSNRTISWRARPVKVRNSLIRHRPGAGTLENGCALKINEL